MERSSCRKQPSHEENRNRQRSLSRSLPRYPFLEVDPLTLPARRVFWLAIIAASFLSVHLFRTTIDILRSELSNYCVVFITLSKYIVETQRLVRLQVVIDCPEPAYSDGRPQHPNTPPSPH